MTHERDVERLLDRWFSDGPREAPDRVLETVTDRIHHRRQRPAWLLARRPPSMNGPIRLLAIVAVLAAALAVGSVFVAGGGQPNVMPSPVPSAAPTPTSTPTQTPTPRPTPSPVACNDGTTTNCTGVFDGGAVASQRFEPAFTATIPSGWANTLDIYRTYSVAPSPHTFDMAIYSHNAIPEQNADCTAVRKKGAGNSVDDWVTFLTTHPGLVTNTPVPVTVGGSQGQRIQFHVDPAWKGRCPNSLGPAVVVFTDDGETPARATWFDDHRVTAWILDVDGQTVIIHVASGPSSDANDRDVQTVQPILDSLVFKPAG